MNTENLPWQNETEFFQIHSKRIFSQHRVYNSSVMGNSLEEFAAYILKNARIKFLGKVLDLGCGGGFMVNSFSPIADCVGISTSSACIEQCRENYPECNFEVGDMATFEYPGASNVLAMESLFYADVKKTIEKTWENLAAGGYFFLIENCQKEGLSQNQKRSFEDSLNYWKYYPHTASKLINIASKLGFQLIEFVDITSTRNKDYFLETLPMLEVPYPDSILSKYLFSGQFLFKKPVFAE